MRKLISVIMVALTLLILPLSAFAAENDSTYTHEELIQLACEVFPEHRATILGARSTTSRSSKSSGSREIVYEATRNYDDSTILNYVEYSDGFVSLAAANTEYKITNLTSTSDSSFSTAYTCSLSFTNNSNGEYAAARNVKFVIASNNYDSITSKGDLLSNCYRATSTLNYATETATRYAYAVYSIEYTNGNNPPIELTYYFKVGNNTYALTTTRPSK